MKGDISMRVDEGMTTFGEMKRVRGGRSVTLGIKRELYERFVVSTVMCGCESWGMRVDDFKNDTVNVGGDWINLRCATSGGHYLILIIL